MVDAPALADVPAVEGIVDQLEDRVEEGGERAHVAVGCLEAAPLVLGERLEDVHHLGVVGLEPVDELALRRAPEGLGAGVDVLVHAPHAERLGGLAGPPGGVEAAEVPLGGVDEVPDDVAHLPVPGGGGRLPCPGLRRQHQEGARLLPQHAHQVVLALVVHEVPVTHGNPRSSAGGRHRALLTPRRRWRARAAGRTP